MTHRRSQLLELRKSSTVDTGILLHLLAAHHASDQISAVFRVHTLSSFDDAVGSQIGPFPRLPYLTMLFIVFANAVTSSALFLTPRLANL